MNISASGQGNAQTALNSNMRAPPESQQPPASANPENKSAGQNPEQEKKSTARSFSLANSKVNSVKFETNYISTTKYTAVTFLPYCLMSQFKRYANIYFLLIAIIQCFPAISPINPVSSIAPLIFVISLSMLREGFEDLARHRSDLELNSSQSAKYINGNWVNVNWKDIFVGDLIRVNQDEFFPADMVCIRSSDLEGNCFIQTSSLDGEKNLKPRMAITETQMFIETPNLIRLSGELQVDGPNSDLYSCNGTMAMGGDRKIALSVKNLLLRGSVLKNTNWIIGAVIYTGKDTKIMKNAEEAKFKQSQIEIKTNQLIVMILIFQIVICVAAAILHVIWAYRFRDNYAYYFRFSWNPIVEALMLFLTMMILTATMIPISLIVSLEMVKLVQAFFINNDEDMYFIENDRHCKVFTSTLNEELGQIEFIFSDKTGTLTCNKMEFKYCVIGDVLYGEEGDKIAQQQKELDKDQPQQVQKPPAGDQKDQVKKPHHDHINFNFKDSRIDGLKNGKVGEDKEVNMGLFTKQGGQNATVVYKNQTDLVKEFFFLLSVCHDCLVDTNEEGVSSYQGQSPDEITLVDAAKRLGYEYTKSTSVYKTVKIFGMPTKIKALKFFEFNSDRKRASIILRDPETNTIKLLTKGADSIIIDRLSKTKPQPYLELTKKHLTKFSTVGLRTLCMAERVLTEEEYAELDQKMLAAATDPDREKIINKLSDEIERDLTLLGCTAVEDRLQNEVPETIRDMLKADVKVWMLTGDKLETAENIGYSCKLIQSDFEKLYIYENDDLQKKYDEHSQAIKQFKAAGKRISLLVEGKAITKLLTLNELKNKLINDVMTKCESVICCRVSPKEKADVVRLVKNNLGKITLAIGDGANDVNMIQEAHIGIGIYGQEGMRAVQASDYALPEFKALWKLLLVHGRLSYIRISEMILYFFYKNMILTTAQFLFLFYNGYSGQTIYDDWYISFYNLAFTSFPLVVRALFDKDIYYRYWTEGGEQIATSGVLKEYYPYLYFVGQKGIIFTLWSSIRWIVIGLVFGLGLFLVTLYSVDNQSINSDGHTADIWFVSILNYTTVVLVVDLKLGMYTRTWTILNWVSIVLLSIAIYIGFTFLGDVLSFFNSNHTVMTMYSSWHFYLLQLLFIIAAYLYDQLVLIWEKELHTPLSILYRSIRLRHNDEADVYFSKVVKINPQKAHFDAHHSEKNEHSTHNKVSETRKFQPVDTNPDPRINLPGGTAAVSTNPPTVLKK
jgi:phospholipid-translocating P-type ATPase (flippase)